MNKFPPRVVGHTTMEEAMDYKHPAELDAFENGTGTWDEEVTFVCTDVLRPEESNDCPLCVGRHADIFVYLNSDGGEDIIWNDFPEFVVFEASDLKEGDKLILTWVGYDEDDEWYPEISKITRTAIGD